MTRILIVDDHDLVRTGLCNILAGDSALEVVGEAASGEQGLTGGRSCALPIPVGPPYPPGTSRSRQTLGNRSTSRLRP